MNFASLLRRGLPSDLSGVVLVLDHLLGGVVVGRGDLLIPKKGPEARAFLGIYWRKYHLLFNNTDKLHRGVWGFSTQFLNFRRARILWKQHGRYAYHMRLYIG